jgi:hypothetical protein
MTLPLPVEEKSLKETCQGKTNYQEKWCLPKGNDAGRPWASSTGKELLGRQGPNKDHPGANQVQFLFKHFGTHANYGGFQAFREEEEVKSGVNGVHGCISLMVVSSQGSVAKNS